MEKQPFNPASQNSSNDAMIVAALERVGESFRVLLWEQAKEHGLSPIQVQVLIFLNNHDEAKSAVTFLAREFNVTKATMSDVVRVLVEKKLVVKTDHPSDSRAQILRLTDDGKQMAIRTGRFANSLLRQVEQLPEQEKTGFKMILLNMIHQLIKDQVITMQRMCLTCRHYASKKEHPYCRLLNIPLTPELLRLDCPEHLALN